MPLTEAQKYIIEQKNSARQKLISSKWTLDLDRVPAAVYTKRFAECREDITNEKRLVGFLDGLCGHIRIQEPLDEVWAVLKNGETGRAKNYVKKFIDTYFLNGIQVVPKDKPTIIALDIILPDDPGLALTRLKAVGLTEDLCTRHAHRITFKGVADRVRGDVATATEHSVPNPFFVEKEAHAKSKAGPLFVSTPAEEVLSPSRVADARSCLASETGDFVEVQQKWGKLLEEAKSKKPEQDSAVSDSHAALLKSRDKRVKSGRKSKEADGWLL
jgi:hypothetical protein